MSKDEPVLFPGLQPARYGNGRRRQRLILPRFLTDAARDERLRTPAQDDAHQILIRWADLETNGRLHKRKETSLHGEFLTDVFGRALRYTLFSENEPQWELEQEFSVPGGEADAAIGLFSVEGGAPPRVLVELKGPTVDLDRHRFNGRTPVQQLWDYLSAVPECPWGIVSNYVSFRLYHRNKTPYAYELFTLQELRDAEVFRRFYVLFEHGGLLPVLRGRRPRADDLLERTDTRQREVGAELYRDYHANRVALIDHLRRKPVDKPLDLAIHIAQKLLDRVVFVAFCEDRELLPGRIIDTAWRLVAPFSQVTNPRWQNFRQLFRSIDEGNAQAGITAYNGGLFRIDDEVDNLELEDRWTDFFHEISQYDFRDEINVDVLGHLFEQSITDLESLRADPDRNGGRPPQKVSGRRKREGVYYTPEYITRYIVASTIGTCLRERFDALAARYEIDSDLEPTQSTLGTWIKFQESRMEVLRRLRVCDPACGSGAFLIQAYDYLENIYDEVLTDLCLHQGEDDARLRDEISATILRENLFGVDLSAEAVEITQLALWVRTAQRGKTLADLSHNVRRGNSVVGDPTIDPAAFDWSTAFPEVTEEGGFDVVLGNPPYVRQELIKPLKPYLQKQFKAYHGMADLYVYFYELGIRLLRPGGRLSFVVTNKWMKAAYAEPLRRFFTENTWMESVVDFGHAKQMFTDADVFPGIIVVRKPSDAPRPATARVCAIPREQLRIDDLSQQVRAEGFEVQAENFSAGSWTLESPAVSDLLEKIREKGKPLYELAGVEPLYGIKTGCNEAFLIDTPLREELVRDDPESAEIIRPYLRGQDIGRWSARWDGLWMIALKSSGDHSWSWSRGNKSAEQSFRRSYPGVYAHMKRFEAVLRKRSDQGRHWWELRACAYWSKFDKPKLCIQRISYHSRIAFDKSGTCLNDSTIILPTEDLWVLCCLNSPVMWYLAFRMLPHKKDEALSMDRAYVRELPIPKPTQYMRDRAVQVVSRLIEINEIAQPLLGDLHDWLRIEHGVDRPSKMLESPWKLDSDAFVEEVKKLRGKKQKFSPASLSSLRAGYEQSVEPVKKLSAEALRLEQKLSDLVNQAYGLTPDEVALMWRTAPPRMPVPAASKNA